MVLVDEGGAAHGPRKSLPPQPQYVLLLLLVAHLVELSVGPGEVLALVIGTGLVGVVVAIFGLGDVFVGFELMQHIRTLLQLDEVRDLILVHLLKFGSESGFLVYTQVRNRFKLT